VVDVAIQRLAHSEDKFRHAEKPPSQGFSK